MFIFNPTQNAYDGTGQGTLFPYHKPINAIIKQCYLSDDESQINIEFATDDGRRALTYHRLNIVEKDATGAEITKPNMATHNLINDLMRIHNLKALDPVMGEISYYDINIKGQNTKHGKIFLDLMGKNVGVIIKQGYYYSPKKGTISWSNDVYTIYNPETLQTSEQMLKNIEGSSDGLLKLGELAEQASVFSHEKAKTDQENKTNTTPPEGFGGAGVSFGGMPTGNPYGEVPPTMGAYQGGNNFPYDVPN